jgi:hypothetical protein
MYWQKDATWRGRVSKIVSEGKSSKPYNCLASCLLCPGVWGETYGLWTLAALSLSPGTQRLQIPRWQLVWSWMNTLLLAVLTESCAVRIRISKTLAPLLWILYSLGVQDSQVVCLKGLPNEPHLIRQSKLEAKLLSSFGYAFSNCEAAPSWTEVLVITMPDSFQLNITNETWKS